MNYSKLSLKTFPFLENLYLSNFHPQKNKQHSSTFITFPHLIALNLDNAHMDYAVQFLFENKHSFTSFTGT